jgi:hypothetical protein
MSKLHERIRDYIGWGIGITFCVASLALSKDKILGLLDKDPIRGTLSIMLLIVTGSLWFLYLKAVRYEIDLIESAFDADAIRSISGLVLPTVIGLSVVFGLLISLSTNIMLYTLIATIYSSLDLYGQNTTIRNINIFIKEELFRQPNGRAESEALFDYYIKRPLLSKISITLVLFCVAFVLSVVGHRESKPFLEYCAYGVVMVTIVAGEIAIQTWRNSRDSQLLEVKKGANKAL